MEADIAKVIRGFECCAKEDYVANCEACPYEDNSRPDAICISRLMRDARDLLKAHDAVKPVWTVTPIGQVQSCGNCGAWFNTHKQKYCHECGRKVKWDG